MFVLVKAATIPEHLRGYASRFLVQVDSNLFVGKVNRAVAEHLWQRLSANVEDGSLTMVFSVDSGEAGYEVRMCRVGGFDVVDLDGLCLIASRRETAGE